MFFLSPSPIFWCQTLQSGGTAAGAHILHSFSTFPSSSSLRLPLFTSLSSSCPGLQAKGPVSSFPLFLHPGCKNLPRLLPPPLFYLLWMKPSQTIKCPEVIHITVMATQREHLTYDPTRCIYVSTAKIFLCFPIPLMKSCENRMSACSH